MFLPFPAAPLKSIIGSLAFFETYEILFAEPADNARMHPGPRLDCKKILTR
jgi:hypothetical protein